MKNSKKHLNLEHNLKNYINRNHRNFKNLNSKTKICICIGSTASVIEALERNYKVFHICCDPDLEKFQSYYWDKIKIYSYSNNIFEYKLKDKGKLIKLNNSKRTNFVTKY